MIREWLDKIILSDHEWKKKYCPILHKYLYELTESERHEIFLNMCRNANDNYRDMLKKAGHTDEVIKQHMESLHG